MLSSLFHLLAPNEKRRFIGLIPWVIFAALFEVVGVASVVPFLSLLVDPDSIHNLPVIGSWIANVQADPLVLLRWAAVFVAAMVILVNGFVIFTNWRLLSFSWGLNHTFSTRLLKHYLGQSYSFILTRNTADLANRIISEVMRLTEDGFVAALDIVAKSAVTIALVGFLVFLDPLLAVVAFLFLAGVYGVVMVVTRPLLRRIGREATVLNAFRLRYTNEALGGFKEVKVGGLETMMLERYKAPSARYARVQAVRRALGQLPRYALEAIAVGGILVVASIMASRTGTGDNLIPFLGAYAFAGLRLLPALQGIFQSITRLRFAQGAIEGVLEDFSHVQERAEITDRNDVTPLGFGDQIVLENISYQYPTASRLAVNQVDLRIPRQGSVALVGRTGSGKTTLADVILGLLPPAGGTISVDGVVVTNDNLPSYRRLFGYVPQAIFLTDGTMAENVAFGVQKDEIDMHAVRRACEAAQLADFIENELADGYESLVGERGIRLSGGQRQRVGIARALYFDPEVLVFDEATSALDVHTEKAVYEALEDISKSRTVVTIAHRLETVENVDHIIVLERGSVVDRGSPAEVLDRYRANIE